MTTLVSLDSKEPWKRRLTLPAYQVGEAARYAKITTQTIRNWQKRSADTGAALAQRDKGIALSYMQLVEVAFVAVLRERGVKLADIREARDYMAKKLKSEFPFAQHRFKTDGQDILMELPEFEAGASRNKLVKVNRGGQLAWSEVIEQKFDEFDYQGGLAIRWHLAGKSSPIAIDPRVAFGAPTVKGVATWAIKGRWEAGESLEDIADDFSLNPGDIEQALGFEGIRIPHARSARAWSH